MARARAAEAEQGPAVGSEAGRDKGGVWEGGGGARTAAWLRPRGTGAGASPSCRRRAVA